MRARISERLDQSGPTVSETVARMEKNGLVQVLEDRHLELTDLGRKLAVEVMRKHRLAELLLAEVIGLDWHLVHEEACRWEHVMSEQVERKILELIPNPTISPFGNLVPGLDQLGVNSNVVQPFSSSLLENLDKEVTLIRIAEPLQLYPEVLEHLKAADIVPGAVITASSNGNRLAVKAVSGGNTVNLTTFDASYMFVSAP